MINTTNTAKMEHLCIVHILKHARLYVCTYQESAHLEDVLGDVTYLTKEDKPDCNIIQSHFGILPPLRNLFSLITCLCYKAQTCPSFKGCHLFTASDPQYCQCPLHCPSRSSICQVMKTFLTIIMHLPYLAFF